MTLKQWADNGWLNSHKTSRQEIQNLLVMVERDLLAAKTENLVSDWRFGIAYNAALKLCTILLYAEGYRPEKNQAHYRTLQALAEVLGKEHIADAKYLDRCRIIRNTVEYDYVDATTDEDAEELIQFSEELREKILDWLRKIHSEFF